MVLQNKQLFDSYEDGNKSVLETSINNSTVYEVQEKLQIIYLTN